MISATRLWRGGASVPAVTLWPSHNGRSRNRSHRFLALAPVRELYAPAPKIMMLRGVGAKCGESSDQRATEGNSLAAAPLCLSTMPTWQTRTSLSSATDRADREAMDPDCPPGTAWQGYAYADSCAG